MASILSRLARAAVATRRTSPSAVGGIPGGSRPAISLLCPPRRYQTGGDIRVSPKGAGGPKSAEEEEKASSKPEVAPHAAVVQPNPPLLVDENVFKSKEAMWAFYEYWCKYYGRSRDRREMERRFKTFSKSARIVYDINSSGVEASMGKFADTTKKEMTSPSYRPSVRRKIRESQNSNQK
uniref:Uncharacterized protein n=1 Tax=Avena sativa TaxID=4498 RepID=A0ACD5YQM4_AVESA